MAVHPQPIAGGGAPAKRASRRRLRETPLSDAVRLPPLPRRNLPGLPRIGRELVPHTVSTLWDLRRFFDRAVARQGPDFVHGYFSFEVLVVGDPDLAREVLLDREKNFSSRMGWHYTIGELFRGGLMLRDFDDHRAQRNVMQHAFRPPAMQGYLDIINSFFEAALPRLPVGRSFRFYPMVKQLGIQLAAELLFGVRFDDRESQKMSRAFMDEIRAAVAVIRKPVPPFMYWRGMKGRAFLEDFFMRQIPERRRSNKTDMFTQLCHAVDENGDGLTDEEITQHMIFLMLAAHDTTASAVTTILANLASSPSWQARVRDELLSFESPTMRYEDRDALVQTEWVFKEAVRMHPPVLFNARRTVRPCKLGSYDLPENAAVTPTPFVTHYLPEWWTNPHQFDPERFSPGREEHRRHPGLYYPFGAGAHMCLGILLANLQAKAMLYQLLRRYRVESQSDRLPKMGALPIPRPLNGLPVRLTPMS